MADSSAPLVTVIGGTRVEIRTNRQIDLIAPPVGDATADSTYEATTHEDTWRYGEIDYVDARGRTGVISLTNRSTAWNDRVNKFTSYWSGGQAAILNGKEIILGNFTYARSRYQPTDCKRGICFGGDYQENIWLGPQSIAQNYSFKMLYTYKVYINEDGSVEATLSNKSYFTPSSPKGKIHIAEIYADSTRIYGFRCYDFHRNFSNLNQSEQMVSGWDSWVTKAFKISVYGKEYFVDVGGWQGGSNSENYFFNEDSGVNYRAGDNSVRDSRGRSKGAWSMYYPWYKIRNGWPIWREDLQGYYDRKHALRCINIRYLTSGYVRNDRAPRIIFQWQKYNPSGKIPMNFGAIIVSSAIESQNPVNWLKSVAKTGTGAYTLTFTDGFFKDKPNLELTPVASGARECTILQISNTFVRVYMSQQARAQDSDFMITARFSGREARQYYLDNYIGH